MLLYILVKNGLNIKHTKYTIMIIHVSGFPAGPFWGGGETPPQKSVTPPQIFTDFIFIHPQPPTPRLLPPKVLQLPPPPKGEILQETLCMDGQTLKKSILWYTYVCNCIHDLLNKKNQSLLVLQLQRITTS